MPAITRMGAALAMAALVTACEPTGSSEPKLAFARLSLEKKIVSLGVDDEFQLSVAVNPDGSPVSWRSLNPDVATVSAGGVVSGRNIGTTMVIAAARRSNDTATISVRAPLASVSLVPDSLSVVSGHSAKFSVQGIDKAGQTVTDFSASPVKWSSSDDSIATVSKDGSIQGNGPGRAIVTLTVNGKTDFASVRVLPAPIASVSITPAPSATLGVGRPLQLSVIVRDSTGRTQTRTASWKSSNLNVATVTDIGEVDGRSTGSTSITASVDGISGTTTVQVVPAGVSTVSVAMNASSLQTGQTTLAAATSRDSNGTVLTGRTAAWSSSNPTVATISPLGVVSALSPGTTSIVATVEGVSASAPLTVTPATVSAVSVSLGSSSILMGNSTQATATAVDALGNPITGRTVAWNTSNPALATVSSLGLVAAIAGGTVAITATIDGVVGSATLVVTQSTIASVTVTPSTASLQTGQTTQATATVVDASGAAVTAPPAWTSSAPAVATVSASGLITAVGPGTSTITASAGGKSGSLNLTVQGNTVGAPAGGTHVAIKIQRFDGGSGTVLVSNAIPLPRGLLFPTGLANVQLFAAGVEQSIYVEALTGLHPDGSLRSVLVQFNYNVGTTPTDGELIVGTPRTAPALARPTAPRATPAAVALPTSPDYLVSTELSGPMLTVSATAALGPMFVKWDQDFVQYADMHWGIEGSQWENDYYDRALIYYVMWARSGNPVYWYRGTQFAYSYRENYLGPAVATYGGAQPHQVQLEGLEKHYILTGDTVSRNVVLGQMELYRTWWEHFEDQTGSSGGNSYSDDRSRARVIMGYLLAWRLDPNGKTGRDPYHDPYPPIKYADILSAVPARMLRTQDPNTGRDITLGTTQLNYMQGMAGDALIRYWLWFNQDPQITTYMTRSANYLWTQTTDGGKTFQYANEYFNWGPGLQGDQTPTADLNNLIANTFAFAYARTGNTVNRDRGNAAFAGGVYGAWIQATKAFNQEYVTSYLFPLLHP